MASDWIYLCRLSTRGDCQNVSSGKHNTMHTIAKWSNNVWSVKSWITSIVRSFLSYVKRDKKFPVKWNNGLLLFFVQIFSYRFLFHNSLHQLLALLHWELCVLFRYGFCLKWQFLFTLFTKGCSDIRPNCFATLLTQTQILEWFERWNKYVTKIEAPNWTSTWLDWIGKIWFHFQWICLFPWDNG